MRVAVLPAAAEGLTSGDEVLLNAMSVIVGTAEPERAGQAAIVREVIDDDRVLVVSRGEDERVVILMGGERRGASARGRHRHHRPAHRIRVGEGRAHRCRGAAARGSARRRLSRSIGGLGGQIERIRDAIELPLRHPELYREHALQPPKGCCCTALPVVERHSSRRRWRTRLGDATGADRSYFLSVKGPELLNKYVGETERYIRTIFERARAKAHTGAPVVVFFDEMDALFRARGSGVSSDMETTIVPQLLTELDGVEDLGNVIVIGASNREDMIDPAILRPGRLDVKIEISRPDAHASNDILGKYLTDDLPLDAGEVAAARRRPPRDGRTP